MLTLRHATATHAYKKSNVLTADLPKHYSSTQEVHSLPYTINSSNVEFIPLKRITNGTNVLLQQILKIHVHPSIHTSIYMYKNVCVKYKQIEHQPLLFVPLR